MSARVPVRCALGVPPRRRRFYALSSPTFCHAGPARSLSLSHTHVHTTNTAKSKSAANDSDPRYLGEICRIEDYMMYVARGRDWRVCVESLQLGRILSNGR